MDMEFLKLLLLYAGLICSIGTALHVNENSENDSSETINYCLQDKIIPLHYNIDLIPHIEEDDFSFISEFNIRIRIYYTIQNISLQNSLNMTLKTTIILSNNKGTIYKPKQRDYVDRLVLMFDDELLPGFYTLYVQIIVKQQSEEIFPNIFYINKVGNRIWLVVKPFLPIIAQGYPTVCKSSIINPTYNISVKHHPKYRALSHMPIREQSKDKDGMIWSHFDTTKMPAYLIAIAVLNFDHVSNADNTVNVWRPYMTSRVKFMHSIAEKIMQYLVQYTKISEKMLKIDHVLLLHLPFKAIAFWNIIIYEEQYVICDIGMESTFCERNVATLLSHEISHQWFGNLIYSSEKWITEGFASFFQAYIVDKLFENWRMTDLSIVRRLQGSLYEDTGRIIPRTIRSTGYPKFDYVDLYYNRAPAILRMLQHVITDEVFREGIIIFLQTHQYHSVTIDDLWSAMQTALDKSNVPHTYFKIKTVMDTWTLQRIYPIVYVTRNYETGETIISQKHFYSQQDGQDNIDQKWWIPVSFATQTNPNFTNTLPTHWLRPQDQNIILQINPNDWFILNLQQIGYYRVNYDHTNWQKIVRYLNSKNYSKIHVLNRAQLIDDAFNLMLDTQLSFYIFLNLTTYLLRETDYIAFYPMFRMLPKLAKYFILPESEYIKPYMERICNSLLEKVGYKENSNEDDFTKLKRIGAIYCACLVGNPVAKKIATIRLNDPLVDYPQTLFLEGYGWAYCSGLMAANMTLWNKVLDLKVRYKSTILLDILACSEDPHIIINYLNINISTNPTTQVEDRTLVLIFVIEKHAWNDLVLDYILQNLRKLTTRFLPTVKALERIILNVVSKEQLVKGLIYTSKTTNSSEKYVKNKVVELREMYLTGDKRLILSGVCKVHEFAKKEFKTDPKNLDIIERLINARLVKLQIITNNFLYLYVTEECPI